MASLADPKSRRTALWLNLFTITVALAAVFWIAGATIFPRAVELSDGPLYFAHGAAAMFAALGLISVFIGFVALVSPLSKGFKSARLKIQGKAQLTEENLADALREVRSSLVQADVALSVAKDFVERVKNRSLGEIVPIRAPTGGFWPTNRRFVPPRAGSARQRTAEVGL